MSDNRLVAGHLPSKQKAGVRFPVIASNKN